MSCYCVCVRQYLKHQEEIQEYSYSQLFARKTLMESIQDDLLDKFKGITLYHVKQARKHASNDTTGMPIEPGHYSHKKLNDAQINHFLDFLEYGGVMQDVANGTRSVKLSTERRATIPNAVRTVHKAEIIRFYTSACDKEGYTKEKGHPSERTLWNILNNCPASQRKFSWSG